MNGTTVSFSFLWAVLSAARSVERTRLIVAGPSSRRPSSARTGRSSSGCRSRTCRRRTSAAGSWRAGACARPAGWNPLSSSYRCSRCVTSSSCVRPASARAASRRRFHPLLGYFLVCRAHRAARRASSKAVRNVVVPGRAVGGEPKVCVGVGHICDCLYSLMQDSGSPHDDVCAQILSCLQLALAEACRPRCAARAPLRLRLALLSPGAGVRCHWPSGSPSDAFS